MAGIVGELRKLARDCLTSANGDYDPARVVGYGIVLWGALQFFLLTLYFAIRDGKFDGVTYAAGLAAISATGLAAAAGVYIKKSTENLPTTEVIAEVEPKPTVPDQK